MLKKIIAFVLMMSFGCCAFGAYDDMNLSESFFTAILDEDFEDSESNSSSSTSIKSPEISSPVLLVGEKVIAAQKTLEDAFPQLWQEWRNNGSCMLNEKVFCQPPGHRCDSVYWICKDSDYASDPRAHFFCICLSVIETTRVLSRDHFLRQAGQELFESLNNGILPEVGEDVFYSNYFIDEVCLQQPQLALYEEDLLDETELESTESAATEAGDTDSPQDTINNARPDTNTAPPQAKKSFVQGANSFANKTCLVGLGVGCIGVIQHYIQAKKELRAEQLTHMKEHAQSVVEESSDAELPPITHKMIKERVWVNIQKMPIKKQKILFTGVGLTAVGLSLKFVSACAQALGF